MVETPEEDSVLAPTTGRRSMFGYRAAAGRMTSPRHVSEDVSEEASVDEEVR